MKNPWRSFRKALLFQAKSRQVELKRFKLILFN
jgi:hypothetical protein